MLLRSTVLLPILLLPAVFMTGCHTNSVVTQTQPNPSSLQQTPAPVASSVAIAPALANPDLLRESWVAYRDRFVQADGRVIDREASDRSISEGQAYTMLRAVLADDPETFVRTFEWAENNLQRKDESGKRTDQLWVWKWGRNAQGKWAPLDPNFASDADIDAITALILAARRWNRPDYLTIARAKLNDLWDLSTVEVKSKRYLLPGPAEAFYKPNFLELNPSYLAPYAFRMFAQIDPEHDWMSLVSSSYEVLEQSAAVSVVGLPSDWVVLNTATGKYEPLEPPSPILSRYGFDAYRVWWRVALDAIWFQAPEATRYLQTHTQHLQKLWRSQRKIPAQLDLQGNPQASYEATSQYAVLYTALRLIAPEMATEIYQQKLISVYRNGFWDNDSAYYSQNLAWLGLLPSERFVSLVNASPAKP
jgi:endoglucanase